MALSKEEKAQLKALQDKEKEPERAAGGVNFTLDLGSDTAWERAKKLGLVPGDESSDDDEDDDDDGDDVPRRGGGYFKT